MRFSKEGPDPKTCSRKLAGIGVAKNAVSSFFWSPEKNVRSALSFFEEKQTARRLMEEGTRLASRSFCRAALLQHWLPIASLGGETSEKHVGE